MEKDRVLDLRGDPHEATRPVLLEVDLVPFTHPQLCMTHCLDGGPRRTHLRERGAGATDSCGKAGPRALVSPRTNPAAIGSGATYATPFGRPLARSGVMP